MSLPRSGSTLLQRTISLHPEVESVSEPWLLLPYLSVLRHKDLLDVSAAYGDAFTTRALSDFVDHLPGGRTQYLQELGEFVGRLHRGVAGENATYFVDKTPRYFLIVDEIMELFPNAKFVLLWRNPLAVVSSIMNTWGKGHWNLFFYNVDLYDGLAALTEAAVRYPDNFHVVHYEDLVRSSDEVMSGVFTFLDLDFDPSILDDLSSHQFEGRMGDQVGTTRYGSISDRSLERWTESLSNPLRKRWSRGYLRWIGTDRLRVMGYEHEDLAAALDRAPTSYRYLATDVVLRTIGAVLRVLPKRWAWRFETRVRALLGGRRG